jgi:hypothetical protein
VGLLKTLFKLALLLFVGAILTGAVMMFKRSKEPAAVSFDEWPDVPQNPAA